MHQPEAHSLRGETVKEKVRDRDGCSEKPRERVA